MDYLLDIYEVNNWVDFNLFLIKYINIDNYIKILIFSILLKKDNNIINTLQLFEFIKPILISLKICNEKSDTVDIKNGIDKLINIYKNNSNEPLLYEKLKL